MNAVLYLAVGMPRAGSGWHYNLMHDLVVAGGGSDAHEMRRRWFLLKPVLTEVNLNIRALSSKRLAVAQIPTLLGHSYTIKTHSALTPIARELIEKGELRASYIYRDPRAALLSALEYGERAREAGRNNAFSHLESFAEGLDFVQQYLRIWEDWTTLEEVHCMRYEDLKGNYAGETAKLAEFLGLDAGDSQVQAVLAKHHPDQAAKERKGQHFQHGEAERFRKVFSGEELKRANLAFEGYLKRMGYSIT